MKRWITMCAATAMCLLTAACGGSQETSAATKTPAAKTVVEAIVAETMFVDSMSFVGDEQFPRLYRIDMEKVQEASMYTGTLASAEEVTVIRMKDAADVGLAVSAMEERLEDQRIAFQDYIPEEIPKIENAQIITSGAYACLVVAEDNSGTEALFQQQFS